MWREVIPRLPPPGEEPPESLCERSAMCASHRGPSGGSESPLSKVVRAPYWIRDPRCLAKTSQFSEPFDFYRFVLTPEKPCRWGGWGVSPFSRWENQGSVSAVICPEPQSPPVVAAQWLVLEKLYLLFLLLLYIPNVPREDTERGSLCPVNARPYTELKTLQCFELKTMQWIGSSFQGEWDGLQCLCILCIFVVCFCPWLFHLILRRPQPPPTPQKRL